MLLLALLLAQQTAPAVQTYSTVRRPACPSRSPAGAPRRRNGGGRGVVSLATVDASTPASPSMAPAPVAHDDRPPPAA